MASPRSWLPEYAAALDVRDAQEHAQTRFIDAYTRLADRTASAASQPHPEPSPAVQQAPSSPPLQTVAARIGSGFPFRTMSPTPRNESAESDASGDALGRLRTDLATTQKSRAALESQIRPLETELKQLNQQTGRDARRILELERERASLERRVRDRDDEIRGKAKLVEDSQDEMVSLNLQLNVAEQRSERLEQENKELVDRWMARMGQEAEEMNQRSKWA